MDHDQYEEIHTEESVKEPLVQTPVVASDYNSYHSYQSEPSYNNLPTYQSGFPVDSGSGRNLSHKFHKDKSWTWFFLAWFVPSSFFFFRLGFYSTLIHVYWPLVDNVFFELMSGAVFGLIWGSIWLSIFMNKRQQIHLAERRASIVVFLISVVQMVYGRPEVAWMESWIWYLWLLIIVRLVWDALFLDEDDMNTTDEIVIMLRPRIHELYATIYLVAIPAVLWLVWWAAGFTTSLLSVTDNFGKVIWSFPLATVFLLITAVWFVLVCHSVLTHAVTVGIQTWYLSDGIRTAAGVSNLKSALTHHFGTCVCASILVPIFSLLTWLLFQVDYLIFPENSHSFLKHAIRRINNFANSSAYSAFNEGNGFHAASSSKKNTAEQIRSSLLRSSLPYNIIFAAIQGFTLTLSGTQNVLAALLTFLLTLLIAWVPYSAWISLLNCSMASPIYFQNHQPDLSGKVLKWNRVVVQQAQ
eukprot:TRINITY_DN21530_c0_g1_i1.p1 TRINITY_DN21530_c0_g1~~TRINITY_DN21530_c0_g1_i1.p1  ORF type:complete len:469 (-),score=102.51 TRINITY_DN21530_c0_g1_i1:30-1436(-)